MEKTCVKCNRPVKETVHTAIEAKIDYFLSRTKEGEVIICIDCKKKKV